MRFNFTFLFCFIFAYVNVFNCNTAPPPPYPPLGTQKTLPDKLATTINADACGLIKYCFLGFLLWIIKLQYVFIIAANVRYVPIDTDLSLLGRRPPDLASNHYFLVVIFILLVSTNNTQIIFILNESLLVSDFLLVISRVLQVFRIFSKSPTYDKQNLVLIVLNIVSHPHQLILFHMIYSVDPIIMLTQSCYYDFPYWISVFGLFIK